MGKSVAGGSSSPHLVTGEGVRRRDIELPRKPVRVTDAAHPHPTDKINVQLEFGQHGQSSAPLPKRPNTSAGPVTHHSIRRNISFRSRENLHRSLSTRTTAHGKETTFYFPLPGSLRTATQSPKESTLPLRKTTLVSLYTAESMRASPEHMYVPAMEIGMALGSPSHQPIDWPQQSISESVTRSASSNTMGDSVAGATAPVKAKASRWKMLGGLFGGKKQNTVHRHPFYQVQTELAPYYSGTLVAESAPHAFDFGEPKEEEERPKSRGRALSIRRKKTKPADIKRANTVPLPLHTANIALHGTDTPNITLNNSPLIGSNYSDKKEMLFPHLDVDIPSTQMERYSVMFGSVLQKPSNNAATLLARRQATLDKLKIANEALASKEQELRLKERGMRPRRATSPQPGKSPGFSLFPNTPTHPGNRDSHGSVTRLRHEHSSSLQRSNTSPAILSPARPTFAPGPFNEAHANLVSVTSTKEEGPDSDTPTLQAVPQMKQVSIRKRAQTTTERSAKPNMEPTGRHLSLKASRLNSPSRKIPASNSDSDEDYALTPSRVTRDTAPIKPVLKEPQWEIITQSRALPPTRAPSNSGSNRSNTSDSSSSASSISITNSTSVTVPTVLQKPSTETAATTRPGNSTRIAIPLSRLNVSTTNTTTSLFSSVTNEVAETAASISIARQISVSRQQRQIIVPINPKPKHSAATTSASPSPKSKHDNNFPAINTISCEAFPLSTVNLTTSKDQTRGKNPALTAPRLVRNGSMASTPTLVVVDESTTKSWNGNTSSPTPTSPISLLERRKGKGNSQMGEIKVGLWVSRTEAVGDMGGLKVVRNGSQRRKRKSERVVVESVESH